MFFFCMSFFAPSAHLFVYLPTRGVVLYTLNRILFCLLFTSCLSQHSYFVCCHVSAGWSGYLYLLYFGHGRCGSTGRGGVGRGGYFGYILSS